MQKKSYILPESLFSMWHRLRFKSSYNERENSSMIKSVIPKIQRVLANAVIVIFLLIQVASVAQATPTDQELTVLGKQFVDAIIRNDAKGINHLISIDQLANKTADTVPLSDKQKADLKEGIKKKSSSFGERLSNDFARQNGRATFIRIHTYKGIHGPLIRMDLDSGYNYLLLDIEKVAGELKIVDMLIAVTGNRLSETMGAISQLMVSPDKSLVGRLFGIKEVDDKMVTAIANMSKYSRNQDFKGAYRVINHLPTELRNHKMIILTAVQYASQLGEDQYFNELKRLAKYHQNDPDVAFTLLDYFFLSKDFDGAMKVMQIVESAYGVDAATSSLKANIEVERGNFKEAVDFASKGMALEPANEDPYWALLSALVTQEKHEECVKTLQKLQLEFGYEFTRADFMAEPVYAQFVKSDAFEKWKLD